MSNWIQLDSDSLNRPFIQRIGDIDLEVHLSPHDVPLAMRALKTDDGRSLRCEFKYIDDEPVDSLQAEHGLRFSIGKSSGRLHAIELPLVTSEGTTAKALKLVFESETLSIPQRFKASRPTLENRRIIKDAILANRGELLETAG